MHPDSWLTRYEVGFKLRFGYGSNRDIAIGLLGVLDTVALHVRAARASVRLRVTDWLRPRDRMLGRSVQRDGHRAERLVASSVRLFCVSTFSSVPEPALEGSRSLP